ncbi:MAG TPA: hypothetical protein VNM90_05460 [Haliangium sp.]|nr:hypothetical protein [Haliangium sp.]
MTREHAAHSLERCLRDFGDRFLGRLAQRAPPELAEVEAELVTREQQRAELAARVAELREQQKTR